MGDNALVVQIGLGVLAIFFIVTLVFSAKTWRWHQIFFLVLTFAGAGTFMAYAAMTLKTHKAWRVEVQKMDADLVVQKKATDVLQYGDVTVVEQEPSLRSVKAAIGRILVDRGRVWTNCQPGNFDGMSVTVQTAPAVPAEGEVVKPNNIEKDAILYVFKEVLAADGYKVPAAYLGEFKATAVTETSVTLAPNIPLDAEQIAELGNNDAPSWALYEIMPLDGHEFFAGLSEEQLRAAMPNNGKIPEAAYNKMIQSYARTGMPADETADPEITRWVKVKFLQKVSVDVDAPNVDLTEGTFFDREGRAHTQPLRRGEAVEFGLGDTAVVDAATAQEWIDAGKAEKLEVIYQRPLNDYTQAFHSYFLEATQLAAKIGLVTRETASIVESTKKSEDLYMKRLAEKAKLEEDKVNFTTELDVITKYETALNAKNDELRKQLKETFVLNQQLAAELARLQQQLADEINKADLAKTAAR